MDVVLEVFDTFVFDRFYAWLLPGVPTHSGSSADLASSFLASNASYSSDYTYSPASQFFSLQPTNFAYMSRWSRDDVYRQLISLYLITWLMGGLIYFFFATLSYLFVFDHETLKHPKYLKNQIRMEITQTLTSLPVMAVFTVPFFILEVRGYSKMYDSTADGPGRWYDYAQFPLFIAFTDMCIYGIHRGLHHPAIYRRFHKPHHKWIVPTPFASHAFHPVDGFSQSIPYHVYPFLFPLQKFAYLALFTFIQIWTVLIHDGEYAMNNPIINGAACHTIHHSSFHFNFGQFTTLWDRLGGSYRQPNPELFEKSTKMSPEEWARQSKLADMYVKEVEGEDDRTYVPGADAVTAKKTQ